jgi:hypothetical protein
MKKIVFLMITLFWLHAEVVNVAYKVEFGLFGEIGVANATLSRDENSYEIDIKLDSTGIAKTLSGNRKERHISKGHIEEGRMVSDLYQIIKSHGAYSSNRIYRIDHKHKKVTQQTQKWKKGKLYKDKTVEMDEIYAKDDLLTLYFNLDNYIEDKNISKDYRLHAVGAEKQNGYVDIHIPTKEEIDEYQELLGKDQAWYAKAIIHQEIFSSDEGELLLGIGQDGITNRAVLKDLILFGDIRAKRI